MIKLTKNFIKIIIFIIIISDPLFSDSFVNFTKINSEKEFPYINIEFQIDNFNDNLDDEIDENNFSIYEDGFKINNIKLIDLSDSNVSKYIVFAIDSSRSIKNDSFVNLKKTVIKLINRIGGKYFIALYEFNDDVRLLKNFSGNKEELIKIVHGITGNGKKTLLFNSIHDSLELLNRTKSQKKFLFVFTDGKDEGSSLNENDNIKYGRDYIIPINFICHNTITNKSIARISKLTGGLIFQNDKKEIVNDIYKLIKSPENKKFLIKYKSLIDPDGQEHQLEIKFKYGEIKDKVSEIFLLQKKYLILDFFSDSKLLIFIFILILIPILILNVVFLRKKINLFINHMNNEKEQPVIKTSTDDVIYENENKIIKEKEINILPDNLDQFYSDVWLMVKDGPDTGKKYPMMNNKEITIGRSKSSDIAINDETVSLSHVKIKNINNKYYLFDLISDNGTYLNEKKLLRPKSMHDWDEIKVGKNSFIFRGSKILY